MSDIKNNLHKCLVIKLLFLVFSCVSSSDKDKLEGFLSVTKVVDGDTFWVYDGSEKGLKIRLIGIDTPETVHPQKGVEYYGKEASDFAKSLLVGEKVKLEFDIDRTDRYGRTLAYVYLSDGTFLNAELVDKGYAHVMTVPPNVKYSEKIFRIGTRSARK